VASPGGCFRGWQLTGLTGQIKRRGGTVNLWRRVS